MAADEMKAIAEHAMAVEEHAEQLATLLGKAGAGEAAEAFTQCASMAREVVKQVPAAPGRDPVPEGEGEGPPPEEVAAAAPPEGGGGGRTPYEGASQELQGQVAAKKQRGR